MSTLTRKWQKRMTTDTQCKYGITMAELMQALFGQPHATWTLFREEGNAIWKRWLAQFENLLMPDSVRGGPREAIAAAEASEGDCPATGFGC